MILPARAEVDRAVALGFWPNGSSFSPDHIVGVRIGSTPEHRWHIYLSLLLYPANLHDFRFFVGGGEGAFRAANAEFWSRLTMTVTTSPDVWEPRFLCEPLGLQVCNVYHQQVDMHGRRFFRWLEEAEYDWLRRGLPLPKSAALSCKAEPIRGL